MTKAPRKKSAKARGTNVSTALRESAAFAASSSRSDLLPDDAEIVGLALDLGKMIETARQQVAVAANAALTTLYWQLGHRIHAEVLEGRRAVYGAQIVAAVGRQLEASHGRGFGEKDLESAILREIERFLLELGAGFAFVERQKRIVLDGDDYYIDLLFFHRRMRRLVVIELKIGDFKPADSGQIELYLRWLDRHERQPSEEAPLGIILCAGKKRETVEYLDLDARGIHVAEYLTELPPREVLEERLHRAIEAARNRLILGASSDVDDSVAAPAPSTKRAPRGGRGT